MSTFMDNESLAGPSTAEDPVEVGQISVNNALSPVKKIRLDMPRFAKPFLRSEMNKRAGRTFFLAFLLVKLELVVTFFRDLMPKHIQSGSYKKGSDVLGYALVELHENLKAQELLTMLQEKQIIVSTPVVCEHVKDLDLSAFSKFLYGNFNLQNSDYYTAPDKKMFNYKLFTDYAIKRKIKSPYTLTYEYSELSKDDSEFHLEHPGHLENAKLYVKLANRFKHSSAACKVFQAYQTEMIEQFSNEQFIVNEINSIIENSLAMSDEEFYDYYARAHLTKTMYGTATCSKLLYFGFLYFQKALPRKRWIALFEENDAGASSIANAFKELFNGVNININVKDETRRCFQLGMAIGRRYVIFDDVRGPGFTNLDTCMRDALDGRHKIILEPKYRDPVEQFFPPGMITTKSYMFTEVLKKRIKIITLTSQPQFFNAHKEQMDAVRFDKICLVFSKC